MKKGMVARHGDIGGDNVETYNNQHDLVSTRLPAWWLVVVVDGAR